MNEFLVSPEDAGSRLDRFLAARLPFLSRSRIQNLIHEGAVRLHGGKPKPSDKLRVDDRIEVEIPPVRPVETLAEDIPLSVLYEDADLIVLNKAAGMVVHPASGNPDGTLVNALLHYCRDLSGIGGEQRPGIVHRLDKDTSGCLVVAKNDATHHALARQFSRREVTKIYLALAAGHFKTKEGIVNAPIGRHLVHRKRMTVAATGKGRIAKTGYKVLAEIGDASLVQCRLFTGRTHQIRVHLKYLGHPLLGDSVYGTRSGRRFERQMLHAWKLGFVHPATGRPIAFVAPVPPDFVKAGVDPGLSPG